MYFLLILQQILVRAIEDSGRWKFNNTNIYHLYIFSEMCQSWYSVNSTCIFVERGFFFKLTRK